MEIIKTDGQDIFSWCEGVEQSALDQMTHIAKLPYVKHCAMMPDAHLGMDCCIGGTVGCDGVVVPNFVGSDCGCGMCSVKTNLHLDDLKGIEQKIHAQISRDVPVGFTRNSQSQKKVLRESYAGQIASSRMYVNLMEDCPSAVLPESLKKIWSSSDAMFSQAGTLGSGNHFLEIQKDEEDCIWVMIHSGSRNIGKLVGDAFNEVASEMNNKWYSEGRDIPYLPVDSLEGKAYLAWMEFALSFAFFNRQILMKRTLGAISHAMGREVLLETADEIPDDQLVDGILNIHHNYASIENHMGKNMWVHRKGATRAFDGKYGIIPGSMGTGSFIVKGLGNKLSLMSCSHGAGRKMGRMAFSKSMEDSMDEIEQSLDGVYHSKFSKISRGKLKGLPDVSEAPAAYKDIESVMDSQKDLVEAVVRLAPVINVKG